MTSRSAGLLASLLALAACATSPPPPGDTPIVVQELRLPSRGVDIPATFVYPELRPVNGMPLVVMAHGHGGTRDEAGGFRRLAEELARRGTASIRIDFPGCGDSTEPFTRNNLGNMIADTRAALAFARAQPGIDGNRTAIVGYSMGGRVAMLALDDGYDAVALWAPAGSDGPASLFPFMGGPERYLELRSQAIASGTAPFVTPWGQQQELGLRWFEDMDSSRPLESMRSFGGPVLVLYGTGDSIIEPAIPAAVAGAAVSSAAVTLEALAGADHGLGFYSGDQAVADRVINATVEFLMSSLQPE